MGPPAKIAQGPLPFNPALFRLLGSCFDSFRGPQHFTFLGENEVMCDCATFINIMVKPLYQQNKGKAQESDKYKANM